MEIFRIVYGAGLGAFYSLLNFSRKRADRRREDVEGVGDLSIRRMLVHVVAGAVAGVSTALQGKEIGPDSIELTVASLGLVPLIENVGLIAIYLIDTHVKNIVPEEKESKLWG